MFALTLYQQHINFYKAFYAKKTIIHLVYLKLRYRNSQVSLECFKYIEGINIDAVSVDCFGFDY